MVLVPPDAAIRLRMETEADLLEPVQPTRPVPADLPELRQGQTFQARILEPLPDNIYRAVVAGKQLTLQLPEGAKTGDELELVVIDRSPRAIIAQRVDAGSTQEATSTYPFMRLSPTARLIGTLLPAEGETPSPAPLSRGQPLITPPALTQSPATQFAETLAKAVSSSGVFYEAHLSDWLKGKLPLAALKQEPQGRIAPPPGFSDAQAEKFGAGGTAPATSETPAPMRQAALPQIPDELRPIVQQQLEATASQRILWQGEIWPQQTFDWEIEWQEERARGQMDEEASWQTRLSLTTPRLGRIEARLRLKPHGVEMALSAADPASAAVLRAGLPELGAALARAGVPLLQCSVVA